MANKTTLFTPIEVGSLTIRNRLMRSSTWDGIATESGQVSDGEQYDVHMELARNNIGIIVFGHTYPTPEGRAHHGQFGLHTDDNIKSFRKLTDEMHAADPKNVLCVQLNHGGRMSYHTVKEFWGPSHGVPVQGITLPTGEIAQMPDCSEMTHEQIQYVVNGFAEASERAQRAGFDCVQVHMAHGWLLTEFLSPIFNKRTDKYGGSLENRMRFPLEVVRAIRRRCPTLPVMVKLNIEDYGKTDVYGTPGMTLEESTELVLELAREGVVLVEASGGTDFNCSVNRCVRVSHEENFVEAYHAYGARAWKKALKEAGFSGCAVALVGGIRNGPMAQRLVASGACDIVAMTRPFLCQPDLATRWKEKSIDAALSHCTSCGACFNETHSMNPKCEFKNN